MISVIVNAVMKVVRPVTTVVAFTLSIVRGIRGSQKK